MGGLVLGAAYGFQFAGYPPCELCWWQRYPYMVAIPLGLLMAFLRTEGEPRAHLLMALPFLATSGIAVFHAGVEYGFWEGLDSCSSAVDLSGSVEDALAAIMDAAVVKCNEVSWSLFGISMAGYNAMIGLALAGFVAQPALKRA